MPAVRVVLVEPKEEGNVGAVARAMRNFDVTELVLVNPCPIGNEAQRRAMHGGEVLASARSFSGLSAALRGIDLIVGTSGIDTESEKRFARIAIAPRELAVRIASFPGRVALVFGREDFGLREEELRACDVLVKIPASETYPILNLSHAVAITLYELFGLEPPTRTPREASGPEKEILHRALKDLLEVTDYPPSKRSRTRIMFRRLIGRAVPSKWEFHALMGVLQRATKRIQRLEKER
jgi:TrmH family RNA methyltransferase